MFTRILVRPLITEKSLTEASKGWYTFIVERARTKYDIARAVESTFQVHVTGVKSLIAKGSVVRRGRRGLKVRSSDYKKARVKLAKGEKIEVFTVEQAIKK